MTRTVLLCRVDGNFGGVERFVLTLAKNLDPQRYRPVVVPIWNDDELARQAREAGIETEFLPMRNRLDIGSASQQLVEIAQCYQADLIHTFGLRSNTLAAYSRQRLGLPWVIRLPNVSATDYQSLLHGWFSQTFNNWLIRRADALQVISPQLEAVVQQWRNPPSQIYVIPNGVDTQYYQPETVRLDILQQYQIPIDVPVIGSVGRLEPIKGFDRLIETYASLLTDFPQARLMLVGSGDHQAELEKLALERKLLNPIIFTGYTSDVRPYLAAIDIFVCSSYSEGVPHALMEAMAMERAVLSTRVGGVESVVTPDADAILMDSNEPKTMRKHLADLLGDTEKRIQLGKAARHKILGHFSLKLMVDRVQRMYDELIAAYHEQPSTLLQEGERK